MSGGCYDYAYTKIEDFIRQMNPRCTTPHRRAFMRHLCLVAAVMKDIESEDSNGGDSSRATESIRAFLGMDAIVESAADHLREQLEEGRKLLFEFRVSEPPEIRNARHEMLDIRVVLRGLEFIEIGGQYRCPSCRNSKTEGHAERCSLKEALGDPKEVKS